MLYTYIHTLENFTQGSRIRIQREGVAVHSSSCPFCFFGNERKEEEKKNELHWKEEIAGVPFRFARQRDGSLYMTISGVTDWKGSFCQAACEAPSSMTRRRIVSRQLSFSICTSPRVSRYWAKGNPSKLVFRDAISASLCIYTRDLRLLYTVYEETLFWCISFFELIARLPIYS